jgi:hypothetical protein
MSDSAGKLSDRFHSLRRIELLFQISFSRNVAFHGYDADNTAGSIRNW